MREGNPESEARASAGGCNCVKSLGSSYTGLYPQKKRVRVKPVRAQMQGYLEKRIQTSMARGRSTKSIWIRASRLSLKNSLSARAGGARVGEDRCFFFFFTLVTGPSRSWIGSGFS